MGYVPIFAARIHIDAGLAPKAGADLALPEAASRHVARVLRRRTGDALTLFSGQGGEFVAEIVDVGRRGVVVRVLRHLAIERESGWPVTLVQAVIAADMMDLVVRKAVELGVATIVPVLTDRSQRFPPERAERRVMHWRQVAIAACEQCGRNRVPPVAPMASLSEWLALPHDDRDPVVILDAGATRSLAAGTLAAPPHTLVAGPEGGLTGDEIALAVAAGAIPLHLGSRVLRAETAALAALATINAIAGDAR